MNGSAARFWERRAALVQQSAQLRARLQGHVQALEPAWQALDGTQRGLAWVRQRPWVLALGLLVLVRKPRALARWGWRAWRAWRWVRPWLGNQQTPSNRRPSA